jgi:hypothetical protein
VSYDEALGDPAATAARLAVGRNGRASHRQQEVRSGIGESPATSDHNSRGA